MQTPNDTVRTEAAGNERDWIQEAFQRYQSALVAYAEHLLGDLESARNVVQEAFPRLCRESGQDLSDCVVPWLYTVCRRRALDLLQKRHRMQPMDDVRVEQQPSGEPTPAATAKYGKNRVVLSACCCGCPNPAGGRQPIVDP